MSNKLQLRRDTAANWETANPTLAQGEIGLILDSNGKIVGQKMGDGVTEWKDLSYDIATTSYINTGISEYPEFSEAAAYAVGEVVLYEGLLKRFTSAHEAGVWDGSQVEDWSEKKEVGQKLSGRVVKLNRTAYSDFSLPFPLLKGTVIKNIGVAVIFAKNYKLEERQDCLSGKTIILDSDKPFAKVYSTAGDVEFIYSYQEPISTTQIEDGAVTENKIADNSITTNKIADNSITTNKIASTSPLITALSMPYNWISKSGAGYSKRITTKKYYKLDHDFTFNGGYIQVSSDAPFTSISGVIEVYDENYKLLYGYASSMKQALTHKGACWFKVTIHSIDGVVDTVSDVNIVKYLNFRTSVLPSEDYLTGKISNENIADGSVTETKSTFFTVRNNLIDTKSEGVVYGKFISSTGSIQSNAEYNITDYIPVVSGKTYYTGIEGSATYARTLCYYDADKKVISGGSDNAVTTLTPPEGASYVRLSYLASRWSKAQLTEGRLMPYEPYSYKLKEEYLNIYRKDIVPPFFLPKDIYVAVGRTIELYYDQVLLGANRYNIQAECAIGRAYDRKFQIIGDADGLGDYGLTINVYNDEAVLLVSGTSTIHIVPSDVSEVQLLPIGDSLTNGKAWIGELSNLSNNITTVGTRSSKHEGRSGANVSFYIKCTGNEHYTYDGYYTGVGRDADEFSESKSYNIGDFVKKSYTFGADQGYKVYVFTAQHTGAWNEDDVYCISTGNPFYDFNNNKFSINFYKEFQGISYNAIMIYLGTNGINLEPENNINGALGIKTLIENIRQEDTSTPIIVVNTIFRSSQNGIGRQGNSDGYSAQSEFKFQADRKVLLLAKALDEMVGSMENVYLCPVGFTHDSKYNFGNNKIEVNPRLTDTEVVYELQPSDSVHPLNCGYLQMADEMFSTICAVFN